MEYNLDIDNQDNDFYDKFKKVIVLCDSHEIAKK